MGRGPSIEGRKNAEDAKRAKVFTKLIRDITLAARNGADPAGNAKLRSAMDKALSANMPKDKIEKAIRRGSGADGGADLQEIRYEGYGPGGVAMLIDALTDNPVRTVADVRHALSKHGGNLGTSGSVAFQFSRTGQISLPAEATDEDTVMEAALDAGAEDVFSEDGAIIVLCPPDAVDAVEQALKAKGLPVDRAEVAMRPANRSAVSGDTAETLQDLLDWLDELDDVQDVFHNASFG
ncbi:YebC/PmpR family DNA-binding transcriptional regulator [Pseudomarimonas salicorniae]|uniref:Probable transcriptional regulatory protein M0G41_00040 n=1 Tax=Pseudomarimonas salicorniae TaxID=2933270 RepID=A0ABT0GBX7_9GAMM|nr:YebC/PmpR family DNA-binding transcriptional regulator [Lysobacter sp. CAU 1642]MCK7592053.1 YebC/PmpR family DNA-binding transcriptional regulator [Lysobacter sp. CAU 1642]